MSLRADRYRQRADDAKHRAAQAKDPSIKSAFEHVTAVWAALADQVERIGFLHATKKTITQSANARTRHAPRNGAAAAKTVTPARTERRLGVFTVVVPS